MVVEALKLQVGLSAQLSKREAPIYYSSLHRVYASFVVPRPQERRRLISTGAQATEGSASDTKL
ncbi:hypothetical protein SCLCIDRAFT_1211497 [Scleroderma citrinum Foug A]|uniref:Uncharacterized protein n=1 Tax=Scleroderma citrinum Foug A TaxID=1036808 RepID=A0A0C3AMR6_9AGAM|nr:hypothetical protein SCLCIDRAFT_1211497 [Scleroderma citrinum Foug A]